MGDEGYEREAKLNQLYLAIISRYKEYIEEKESIAVAELPTLVSPKNPLVVAKANEIKSSFGTYNYSARFNDAGRIAFDFVRTRVGEVTLPLQFWISPEETLRFMMGDVMDKNILLCSLLIALGNPSAKVLVTIRDSSLKAVTYYELNGKAYAMDLSSGIKEYQGNDAFVATLGIDDETTAYEFNDQMYRDIS
ncbi:MAG: hypothetical protein KGH98_03205 [Candidatus Micrarchaeota archaeon]|nr:hypothetical protein [Candidatus Micrarchaeota archaeon]